LTRSSSRQLARFLVVGALNTGLSYLVYLALLRVVSYRWAYSISYAAGIVLSFVLNSLFVFRVPLSWQRLLPYPSVYLVQYLLGLCVVHVGVELLGWDERLMPIAVLVVTVPVSFVLTRWVLREKEERKSG
jgi:putative flippase GtrA